MTLWLNGELLDPAAARINPADRGFLLGDGVFETLRLANGRVVRLAAHLARLRSGLAVIGLPLADSDDCLAAGLAALIAAAGVSDGSLRLTVSRGPGLRGLLPPIAPTPTVMITVGGLPPETPAHLIVANSTRRNEYSPLSRIKSLNYLDNILARQEAERAGADDSIMLNTAGRVAESTVANIFWVKNGHTFTPPVTEGALPGLRRAAVMAALPVVERAAAADELRGADEVFLVNSLSLRSVASLDGRPVGWSGNVAEQARALTLTD